jgi:integrase
MSVKVRVFHRAGRKFFEAQWSDPITGKKRTKSTGKTRRSEAERVAAKLESAIEEGRHDASPRLKWKEFRSRYEAEALPALAEKTAAKMRATFNAIEDGVSPLYLESLTANQISKFQKFLRDRGAAEATIKSHLACLKAAFGWGKTLGLIREAPQMRMPDRVGGMKGRAPTAEEFERIKAKAAEVVGEEFAASWTEMLDGLWWSGLRLGEAVNLHWTDDRQLCIDFSGRHPMFRIQATAEKGNTFRMLPIAPEFADWLAKIPPAKRRGHVFNPLGPEGLGRLSLNWVSRQICRMGEEAGVKVAERKIVDADGNPGVATKYASAHDFRRAFGYRWAHRVMPIVLQELMRHASIQTTMEYYVGKNADATADQVWKAFANETANTAPVHRPAPIPDAPQTHS